MACYPEAHAFSSAATKWGMDSESKARQAYKFMIADKHNNLSVADCEFHINERWPFWGASPDGLVDSVNVVEMELVKSNAHANLRMMA